MVKLVCEVLSKIKTGKHFKFRCNDDHVYRVCVVPDE